MNIHDIKRITVVGAGLMGHGIAQEFACAGYEVSLHARTEETLQKAIKNIQDNLQRLLQVGLVTTEQVVSIPMKIRTSTLLKEAVSDTDLVIESVYEDIAVKQQVFQDLDRLCPGHTILASNTSSLIPSLFTVGIQRPDKVLVAHYVNPPYLVPLVELVRGGGTSDETITTVCDLLKKIGKQPVVVQKEIPGFITNRLQMTLLREALWLVQKGIASPQDIDMVIKTSLGRRWAVAGVFEVLEIPGWDLVSSIAAWLFPYLESPPGVPPVLKELVEQGKLGVKSGKGFYDWTPEKVDALKARIAQALVQIEQGFKTN
jgi:3-hydroxybutyryl-CoA dehydrogenase